NSFFFDDVNGSKGKILKNQPNHLHFFYLKLNSTLIQGKNKFLMINLLIYGIKIEFENLTKMREFRTLFFRPQIDEPTQDLASLAPKTITHKTLAVKRPNSGKIALPASR